MSRTTRAAQGAVTQDAFLGGRLTLSQPRQGYRAGIDPVLLAASVEAEAGHSILDLGCGVGTAMLCLHTRVPGLRLTGVDLDPTVCDLARANARAASAEAEIVTADLRDLPMPLRAQTFDRVVTNPPFFDRADGARARDAGRDLGRGGPVPLEDWLEAAIRRVRPKGRLTLIQPAGRLDRVIAALHGRLGSLRILPLCPRAERPPHLVIVEARHGGRSPLRLASALPLHDGAHHGDDRPDYSRQIERILRNGEKLPIDR
ncbi:methyltransferase domain-containing protein [Salipiger sp. IMCC34102]|uniref:tRNA1(Val) (adenine(37)-N6)-methyltransferase n=1 Tax=Salipiger sp. IMCC34102 TaxID=2510647 RepID=UPI00101D03BE|nr:methyltransferase domain-containing protein [Salipiger sp. IMCC34102]RYH01990.1 methyltransferase domain-containing protein [Salipiger sp. IMCC34102]